MIIFVGCTYSGGRGEVGLKGLVGVGAPARKVVTLDRLKYIQHSGLGTQISSIKYLRLNF